MSSRRITVLAILATSVTVLAVPVAGQAKIPNPKVKTIVFGKSVAGVKLGASVATAKAAWGTGAVCTTAPPATQASPAQVQCQWVDAHNGGLNFTAVGGKVVSIAIQPAYDPKSGATRLTGPITAFRTSKGIGIGSTLKALRKAYPKAKDGAADSFVLFSGKITTSFGVQGGKIASINISVPAHY